MPSSNPHPSSNPNPHPNPNQVETTSTEKLTLPLLTRESRSGELSVNFDPLLVKLLSEVKYFVVQGKNIPEVAADP